jgi:HlyD family secretion protein
MHKFLRGVATLVLVAGIGLVLWAVWQRQERKKIKVPDGIAWGNGRVEATQVDIAAKYGARIAEVLVKEGAIVSPDQVLCRMDTSELEASLEKAKAEHAKADEDAAEAAADVVQKEAAYALSETTLARSEQLKKNKAISSQQYDEDKTRRDSAKANVEVSKAKLRSTKQAVSAAEAEVRRVQSQLDDSILKSPVRGRVLYRLAEPGEVVGSGGKVLTVLDLSDIYMEIFLPAHEAAATRVGAEARIVLDVRPEYAARAKVSFVSPEAQFTPKQVETRSERDKLMFRLKLQVPPAIVLPYIDRIKTGLRGVGYVRLDDSVSWPDYLEKNFPAPPPNGEAESGTETEKANSTVAADQKDPGAQSTPVDEPTPDSERPTPPE